jgi:hypothetical protein
MSLVAVGSLVGDDCDGFFASSPQPPTSEHADVATAAARTHLPTVLIITA